MARRVNHNLLITLEETGDLRLSIYILARRLGRIAILPGFRGEQYVRTGERTATKTLDSVICEAEYFVENELTKACFVSPTSSCSTDIVPNSSMPRLISDLISTGIAHRLITSFLEEV